VIAESGISRSIKRAISHQPSKFAANKVPVSKADDKSSCLGLISSLKQSLLWGLPSKCIEKNSAHFTKCARAKTNNLQRSRARYRND
jgi:hypothetical protein